MKDIDKLYLEYCGYRPEEADWDYTTSQKYKTFKAGYDAMQKLINDKNFALKSRIIELETDLINTKAVLKESIAQQREMRKQEVVDMYSRLPC